MHRTSTLLALLLPAAAQALEASDRPVASAAIDKDDANGLPTGNGALFRKTMLDWNREAPAPAPRAFVADPVFTGRVTSYFGLRRDPLNGRAALHKGIDIAAPSGTPIRASAGGTVRFAGTAGGYGQLIVIDHGNGVESRYAHLSHALANTGDLVSGGEVIGLMGSTGRSTGSHLHWEVRLRGAVINPVWLDDHLPPPTIDTTVPVTRHWLGWQGDSGALPSAADRANWLAPTCTGDATTGTQKTEDLPTGICG